MNYRVEINQSGRGGTIYYFEGDQRLAFDWEFSMSGTTVFVPPPGQWDKSCESAGFAAAAGRRNEILERTAVEVCRQKASGAKYEIGDNWLEFVF